MDGNNSPDGGQAPMVQSQDGTFEQLASSSSGGAPFMDPDDWRTQLPLDSRQWMVDTILETLKKHQFSVQEELQGLKKIAVRYEEKIYSAATSQSDYLRKISLMMLTLETNSQSPMANSLQTGVADASRNSSDQASNGMQSQIHNPGLAMPIVGGQSQGSQNMQNNISVCGVRNSGSSTSTPSAVSNLTQGGIANAVGQYSNLQNMQNNSNVATKSVMKQKLQPGSMTQPMLQSHAQNQHQILIQTGQIPCSQQAVIQPTMMQSASLSGLQQNHQSSGQQPTQQMLEQQPQPVLRQHQPQQPQQVPIPHQQQTSMAQQPMMQTAQQTLTGQVSSDSGIQQNQLIGQQNNIQVLKQQIRLMSQQNNIANLQQQQLITQLNNIPNMHQLQMGGGVSGLQQSKVPGMQSIASSGMPSNQHSAHMLQQKVPVQQQMQQNVSLLQNQTQQPQPSQQQMVSQSQPQSGQMQHLQPQSNSLQGDMQQQLPTSGAMLQRQNLVEQQNRFFQSRQAMQEASSNSTAQTGNAGAEDWQEEAYQKIKSMKDVYLLELNELYLKIAAKWKQHADLPEQPANEQRSKLKFFMVMLERLIQFLQLSKNDIPIDHKDKLGSIEKQILNILNSGRPRKPVSLQPGQLPQPGIQNSQPQSQISQMQTQPLNPQTSAATMAQNNLSTLHQNTSSSVPSVSNPLINSLQQPSFSFGLGQNSSLLSPQQVAVNSLEQNNTLSGPQSVNLAGPLITSQAGVNVLQPNLYSLQMNSSMLQEQHLVQQLEQVHHQRLKQQRMQQLQMHSQKLLQRQLTKLQPSAQLPGHTISPLHQITGSSDAKMSQQVGVKPGVFQQQPSPQINQKNSVTSTKTGTPSLSAKNPYIFRSPSTHVAPSPMNASLSSHPDTNTGHIQAPNAAGSSALSLAPRRHPSPQVNQQNLVTSSTKSETPLASPNSPVIVPSPSTPVAPSPVHAKSEKVNAGLSSHPDTVTGHLQVPNAAGSSLHTLAISINGESEKVLSSEPNTNSEHVQAPNAAGSSAQTLAISIGESEKVNASLSSHPNTNTVHFEAPNAAGSSVLPLSISIGESEIVSASLSSQPNTHIIHLQAPNPAGSSANPLAISITITIA